MQQMFLKVNIAAYAHLMSLLYAESVSVRPAAAVCTDPNMLSAILQGVFKSPSQDSHDAG